MTLKRNSKETILKAITSYNRYRSPEAKAELVKFENTKFTIEFSGSFCYGCGVEAYVEDFIYELKRIDSKISVGISKFKQTSADSYEIEYEIITPTH